MTILFVFLGLCIALLKKINKALAIEGFTWKIFFNNNIVPMSLNLITGVTLVLAFGITKGTIMFNDRDLTYLACVMLGLSGNYLFDMITETATSKFKTYLGK